MPDYECTSWWDGIPTWLGGTGREWLHCCVAHDLGASDRVLQQCVDAAGYPLMAFVMFVGVSIFGPIYRWWKR